MSNIRVYEKSFAESWAYANVLKNELGTASYDVQPSPGSFKSGRPQFMATFLNSDREVISRRIGMELTSKQSGAPYRVFSRQEWVHRDAMPRTILKREQSSVDQVYTEA